jgi:hypothetical protein
MVDNSRLRGGTSGALRGQVPPRLPRCAQLEIARKAASTSRCSTSDQRYPGSSGSFAPRPGARRETANPGPGSSEIIFSEITKLDGVGRGRGCAESRQVVTARLPSDRACACPGSRSGSAFGGVAGVRRLAGLRRLRRLPGARAIGPFLVPEPGPSDRVSHRVSGELPISARQWPVAAMPQDERALRRRLKDYGQAGSIHSRILRRWCSAT